MNYTNAVLSLEAHINSPEFQITPPKMQKRMGILELLRLKLQCCLRVISLP